MKCTRCNEEIGEIRYLQLVDANRNWAIRTEQMKPICETCGSEIAAFAAEKISRKQKRTFTE